MLYDAKGFIVCKGLPAMDDAQWLNEKYWLVDNRLHKFCDDEVVYKGDVFHILDGYITNKSELIINEDWTDTIVNALDTPAYPSMLRGSFSGIKRSGTMTTIYVDHVGSRALYYYHCNGVTVISSRYVCVVDCLKACGITINPDEQAVKYMLEKGFMLDDTSFCKEIKRVEPGNIVVLHDDGRIEKKRYYMADNGRINEGMSVSEAVEGIDRYFRQAIKREFDKDIEYGYDHLVDLSGGLDSRMVTWVAHDMGYVNQLNYTYCKSGYLDHKISEKIACELGHRYLFMPLDDFGWFMDVEENSILYNGATIYNSLTGANRFLKGLNCSTFGIEHTGMNGDIILSTYFGDKEYNYSAPTGREKSAAKLAEFDIPSDVVNKYHNKEQFVFHTRGMLGVQSSYFVRQNYVECSSPFMDVDLLNFVFSIPFELRKNHRIYHEWMKRKYPKASSYGWETWYGIKPYRMNIPVVKFVSLMMVITEPMKKVLRKDDDGGMNPMDYWLSKYPNIKLKLAEIYKQKMSDADISEELIRIMNDAFASGSADGIAATLTCATMLSL